MRKAIVRVVVVALLALTPSATLAQDASPAPSPDPTDREARIETLLSHAEKRKLCRPMKPKAVAWFAPDAMAGIRCKPPKAFRIQDEVILRYYLFADTAAMGAWWNQILTQEPDGPWRRVGAHRFPIATDSGSMAICTRGIRYAESWGETGWASADGASSGRMLCWKGGVRSPLCDDCVRIDPNLYWTVDQELIGGAAVGVEATYWFARTHPDRVQAYRTLGESEEPHPPFADPAVMLPLPGWVEPLVVGVGGGAPRSPSGVGGGAPRSPSGLVIGIVHRIVLGHCDGLAAVYNIDGSDWVPVAGLNPSGGAIKGKRNSWVGQGTRAEFLLIASDAAQIGFPDGHIVAYERSPLPLLRRWCR